MPKGENRRGANGGPRNPKPSDEASSHTHPDRRPAKMQRITVISIKALGLLVLAKRKIVANLLWLWLCLCLADTLCVCVCWVLRNREAVTVKRANYCDAARWETWISESGQNRGFNVGFCLLCTMRRMSNLFTRRRVSQKSTKNAQRPEALWLNLLCFDYVSAQPRLLRLRFCCIFLFPGSVLCIFEAILFGFRCLWSFVFQPLYGMSL